MEQPVDVTTDGAVTTITINRVARANALDRETARALGRAVLATYQSDRPDPADAPRVIVITGAGDRAFVAGADLDELASFDVVAARSFISELHDVFDLVRRHPRPVLAAVNGHALGAGLELMLSCDIAIAAEHAMFGMPEVAVGLPSVIEGSLLVPTIGLARAREMLLTAESIDAHEAHRIGLVNRVVPSGNLAATIHHVATRLLRNAPGALDLQKRLLNQWLELSIDEAIAASITTFASAYETDEPQRYIGAFRSRRRTER